MKVTKWGDRLVWAFFGLALVLVLWRLLAAPAFVERSQAQLSFKIVSGGVLALALAAQWLLALARSQGEGAVAKRLYLWHDLLGALTPTLLLVHSRGFGYGYLALLSGVFWINAGLGLVAPGRLRWLRPHAGTWLVAHIACSVLVTALSAYHVWTALMFE